MERVLQNLVSAIENDMHGEEMGPDDLSNAIHAALVFAGVRVASRLTKDTPTLLTEISRIGLPKVEPVVVNVNRANKEDLRILEAHPDNITAIGATSWLSM